MISGRSEARLPVCPTTARRKEGADLPVLGGDGRQGSAIVLWRRLLPSAHLRRDMAPLRPCSPWLVTLLMLVVVAAVLGAQATRNRGHDKQNNSFRKAATGFYQTMSSTFGEENVRAVQKFFSRLTERFVYGVDVLVDTLWRIWTDLLDVLGIDASNLTHYFNPASVANNPTRVLMLVVAVLLAYWFASLFLGFFFYVLHVIFGRFFWLVRVCLFALSCVYILQKYEGEPEHAMLPLCFVVAIYFMTGPVGVYWRRNNNNHLEDKIDHLDNQIRLLNIRLTRVIESLDRASDQ